MISLISNKKDTNELIYKTENKRPFVKLDP